MAVQDESTVRPVYDRSFAGRFARALEEFVIEFMRYETGYVPGTKLVCDTTAPNATIHAVAIKTYMALPSPRVEINATVMDA